jgi:hypothetical protein
MDSGATRSEVRLGARLKRHCAFDRFAGARRRIAGSIRGVTGRTGESMLERKGLTMFARGVVLAMGSVLALGCAEREAEPPGETQEIIANLVAAGFPSDDIMVVGGVVYVGRDAEVSLAASREMLQDVHAVGHSHEQYRTTNLVSAGLTKICINGSTFTGVFSTALDLAIQNYDQQPITFAMARTPSAGCSFTINAVIQAGLVGGFSGFPSGGLPFGTITIGGGLSAFSVDTIEHVITHEIGHTIGFRHSDFFDRSISCGGSPVNEESPPSGLGAIFVPGTPSGATVGGSLMNACFRTIETGEFTASDVIALRALYTPTQSNWRWCHKCQGLFFAGIPGAVCPAGGAHDGSLSGNYVLLHSVGGGDDHQDNWRWCHKCQGLFFGGIPGAVCPAGGAHDGSLSGNYTLLHTQALGPNLQEHWRWCHKCQGLFFGDIPGAVCPAGGAHDGSLSGNYALNFL